MEIRRLNDKKRFFDNFKLRTTVTVILSAVMLHEIGLRISTNCPYLSISVGLTGRKYTSWKTTATK